jgi:hypothetical protein
MDIDRVTYSMRLAPKDQQYLIDSGVLGAEYADAESSFVDE